MLKRVVTHMPDWLKNLLLCLFMLAVVASCFGFSVFMFYLKIQAANYLFG